MEKRSEGEKLEELKKEDLMEVKEGGFSDVQIAWLLSKSGQQTTEEQVREKRHNLRLKPVFKMVDTCAAEFPAETPYYSSTYECENESVVSDKKKIMILGSGPNRIGQGIEFAYACVHAVMDGRGMG